MDLKKKIIGKNRIIFSNEYVYEAHFRGVFHVAKSLNDSRFVGPEREM